MAGKDGQGGQQAAPEKKKRRREKPRFQWVEPRRFQQALRAASGQRARRWVLYAIVFVVVVLVRMALWWFIEYRGYPETVEYPDGTVVERVNDVQVGWDTALLQGLVFGVVVAGAYALASRVSRSHIVIYDDRILRLSARGAEGRMFSGVNGWQIMEPQTPAGRLLVLAVESADGQVMFFGMGPEVKGKELEQFFLEKRIPRSDKRFDSESFWNPEAAQAG